MFARFWGCSIAAVFLVFPYVAAAVSPGVVQQQAQGGAAPPGITCTGGVTCIESTICASGCDYVTPQAWVTATAVDMTGLIHIGTVTEDFSNQELTIDGATNVSAENFRILRGGTALNHVIGTPSNIRIGCDASFGRCVNLVEEYVIVEDLEIENVNANSAHGLVMTRNTRANRIISRGADGIGIWAALGPAWVSNSLVHDSEFCLYRNNWETAKFFNITCVNSNTGFHQAGTSGAPVLLKNVVFHGNTIDMADTINCDATSTNNATSDVAAPTACGGTWVTGVVGADFNNAAGLDFEPVTSTLQGAGADSIMPADLTNWPLPGYSQDMDVRQSLRTTGWDIGGIEGP